MPTRADYWIDPARYDLASAKAMLKAKRRLYVGFICHLAIEKTLKACWAKKFKTVPPFTHDLSMLAQRTGILAQMDARAVAVVDVLEPLHIAGDIRATRPRC